ncbi:MAG TPA: histidine phosphatase family protein [Acidimicrobiales bacterium]|jgi:8-oxo-dGTP diphosphatase|nr:histidine phosphatase family protein [Acidimicrobiales bacterium]
MSEPEILRLAIVRHAHAGSQKSFDGPDHDRPLTARGQCQTNALTRILAASDIGAIVSSPWLRCRQTVQPLSDSLGIPIETMIELAPDATEEAGFAALVARAKRVDGRMVVASTHGENFPVLLRKASTEDGTAPPAEIEKAGRIEVTIENGTTTDVDVFGAPKAGR